MPDPSLLSDAQFAALLAVIGTLGGAVVTSFRWAVGRVVKAIDESTSELKKQGAAFVEMGAKLNHIHEHVVSRERVRNRVVTTPVGYPHLRTVDDET